jgi:hypothetical protein
MTQPFFSRTADTVVTVALALAVVWGVAAIAPAALSRWF